MNIPDKYKGKYFFHFTHINNIDEIIRHGLLSTNEKTKKRIRHLDVASKDIQCTRREMKVSCGNGGVVHDYVPFYFCPRTPMFLSIIKSRNYDQQYFVHFALSIDKLKMESFIFTDKAANREFEPPNFFNSPADLDKLNWDEIDNKSWRSKSDGLKHQKMAEALHHGHLSTNQIDYIVVWNDFYGKKVRALFEKHGKQCPPIFYDGKNRYYHYYCDLNSNNSESLVCGPIITKETFEGIVKNVIKERKNVRDAYLFDDIESCLNSVRANFSCIQELENITNLRTDNVVHKDNVENHTKNVINALLESDEYDGLSDGEKLVVELAAYLHDIGKGPKSRWRDGVQRVDDDHPRKSAIYLERFLIEDIDTISNNEIRQLILIVMYHDFIGDHIISGRKISELKGILQSESDLKLLYTLCKADVMAIHAPWYNNRVAEWLTFYKEAKGYLND
ncbi:DUF4433 domain-containing protein [Shewanella algae]|uniref:DarT ssDNA thymidine ADP-ribosyltransferase family protein n=1 Tax=Shewanella algae TaxID=38313 RepID=UPI001AAC69C5|nr:DarT ssDNA thymidine ADP-ribosyltransferase family protein [Shewanella algae]MBO2653205.1 DUF4433 domain-containing protein [Shewanella algae]